VPAAGGANPLAVAHIREALLSEASENSGSGPAQRQVEIGVAAMTGLFGLVVMYGSYLVGIDWGVEGPRSGFFPFYVGLLILGCSALILVQNLLTKTEGLFADWTQLRSVMAVVIPTAIYVMIIPGFQIPYTPIAIPGLGLYVSSVLLIAGFMIWLGNYGLPKALAVAIGVPAVTYLMFEKWFLVPLPKGPIENLLGL
jgi:hypothetical protein